MRIIAGSRKRTPLLAPKDRTTRPITDRVKENLFSLIHTQMPEIVVADLFCGTGSIGLEALSRGASRAIFVDRDFDAITRLKKNIEKCRYEHKATVLRTNTFRSGIPGKWGKPGNVDMVFLDPPFPFSRKTELDSNIGKLMLKVSCQLADDAIVIIRHEKKVKMLTEYDMLQQYDHRIYGVNALTLYRKVAENIDEVKEDEIPESDTIQEDI